MALTNSPAANTPYAASFYDSEPPFLAIGTEVSAKYKGAFCEARIQKVQRLVKCRVTFRNSLGAAVITDDNIKGALRVGATVEAKHPDKNAYYEANITKIIDASLYTVVFDDGDVTTLRRTSLCLKSGKHFSESESLDHLPLTNPEHFGNPVSLGVRGTRKRRRRSAYGNPTLSDNEDADSYDGLASGGSVDDEDSNTNSLQKSTKDDLEDTERRDPDCGKLICVDYGDKRSTKLKDGWFPALIVHPSAQENNSKIDTKEEHLVKSFINGRFYQLQRKDAKEFTKAIATQTLNDSNASSTLKSAVEKALLYLDKDELPSNWDYDLLVGSSASNEPTEDGNLSSDLEFLLDEDDIDDDCKTNEEKDRFVAQLYKFMDERGTPINKTPNVGGKDLDLYNLYRLVNKLGGYNRVTNKNGWKAIYNKLNLPNTNNNIASTNSSNSGSNSEPTSSESNHNQLKLAYKKFLLKFVDFYRKLGCTMVNTCLFSRTSARTARSERNWRTTSESKETPKVRRKKPSGVETKEVEKEETEKLTIETKSALLIEQDDDKSQSSKKNIIKKPRKNARKKYKLIDPDDSSVNGNEPEEKYIPGDSDSESDSEYQLKTPTISKEVSVIIGDRIRVKYGKGKQLKVYEAKILKVNQDHEDVTKHQYFVHYTGWNIRYDEWIKRNRIVEVVKDKSPKRRGGAKSKNKGVPLNTDELKEEQTIVKESKDSRELIRNDNLLSKRNNRSIATPTKIDKILKEDKIRKELERKLSVQHQKRTRQRSDCTEIASDNEEPSESIDESLPSNVRIKIEPSESIEEEEEEEIELNVPSVAKSKSIGSEQTSEQISLDEFETSKTDSPATAVSDHLLLDDESESSSKLTPSEELAIKKEAVEILHPSESNSESSSSVSIPSLRVDSRADSESTDKPDDKQSIKSIKLTIESVKKQTKPVESEEKSNANGQLDADLAMESESNSIDDENSSKQSKASSRSISSNSSKSDEDIQRKRKTRKNKVDRIDDETTSNKSGSELTVKKKKSGNGNQSSNEEEDDFNVSNENVDLIALKRKRTGSRSMSECEKLETQSMKRQRSTSESEPPPSSSKPEVKAANDVLMTEIETETTGAPDIGAASFLLCKEEIPASPVCESNEEVAQSKSKANKETDSVKQDKEAASSPKEKEDVTIETELQIESVSVVSSTAAIDLPSSISTSCTFTTAIATELSASVVKDSIDASNTFDGEQETIETENTECTKQVESLIKSSCEETKVNSDPVPPSSEKLSKQEMSLVNELNDLRKSNEENIQTDDSVLASPRKKRRGRARTASHCDSSATGSSNLHLNTNAVNSSVVNGSSGTSNSSSTSQSQNFKDSSSKEPRSGCKTRGSMSRRTKHNSSNSGGMNADANNLELDNHDPLSPGALSSSIPAHFEYQPVSKYNFCSPLDESLDSDRRIQILQERLQEVRKTYLHLKSEVNSIDRKKKKLKRKERSSPSSPGSSSQHSDQKNGSCSTKDSQRSQSNSDGSGTEEQIGKDANGNESIASPVQSDEPSNVDNKSMLPNLVTVLKAGEMLSERA